MFGDTNQPNDRSINRPAVLGSVPSLNVACGMGMCASPEQKPEPAPYVPVVPTAEQIRNYHRALDADLARVEEIHARGLFDRRRQAGVELEYVLIGPDHRSLPSGGALLAADPKLQSELSACNVEIAPDPFSIGPRLLSDLERTLRAEHQRVEALASRFGARAVLCGILPSYEPEEFTGDRYGANRYRDLNAALLARSEDDTFHIDIAGKDRLAFEQPSILLQSLNTSFQLHVSAPAHEIAELYNVIQAVTAPLVAVSANSSLIFGKRVWHESRIPVWEQSTDPHSTHERHVTFGRDWVRDPLELFRDLKKFDPLLIEPALVSGSYEADASERPELRALGLLNGTVWRWNRICYGADERVPHLRVEFRPLPAGPTIEDMLANAALFYGTVFGLRAELRDRGERIESLLAFSDAEANFRASAKEGLDARLTWFDETLTARELVQRLLPTAERGLREIGIPGEEVERYLAPIRGRLATGQTGAAWLIAAHESLSTKLPAEDVGRALTGALHARQTERDFEGRGTPVHEWSVP